MCDNDICVCAEGFEESEGQCVNPGKLITPYIEIKLIKT